MDNDSEQYAIREATRLRNDLQAVMLGLVDLLQDAAPVLKGTPDTARKIALARTNAEQAKLWLADALADLGGEVGT